MSEMLANRYFLARQFDKACFQYEKAMADTQAMDKIKKRLIICYVQSGQIEKAINYFYDLVRKDPNIIINTDAYYDDCPCQELIPNWENKIDAESKNKAYPEVLGMLYLFCDLSMALKYFKISLEKTRYPKMVSTIIKKLSPLSSGFLA